tara:strand:+ start:4959 stop:5870 length:912 start_codon:yes stop_codon:yes gene_type:complete
MNDSQGFNTNSLIKNLSFYSLNNTNISNVLKNIPVRINNKFNLYKEHNNNKLNILNGMNGIFVNCNKVSTLKPKMSIEPSLQLSIKTSDLFKPIEGDNLFWCWIINTRGLSFYEKNLPFIYQTEHELKMECVEFIYKNEKQCKVYAKLCKFKLEEILLNLQEEKINIDTFIVLCLMYEINTIILTKHFLFDRILWDIGKETPKKNCFIKQSMKNDEYVNEYEVYLKNILDDHTEVNDFYNKLCDNKLKLPLKVDSLSKPIKNISYYKKDDLINICKQFDINTMKDAKKTKNKKELYQAIMEVI